MISSLTPWKIHLTSAFIGGFGTTFSLFYCYKNFGDIHPVDGPSMKPTFYPDLLKPKTKYFDNPFHREFVISRYIKENQKTSEKLRQYRGKIVIVQNPRKREKDLLIKRVSAVSGDKIKPLRVGQQISDSEITIPDNHIWVESDAGFGYKDSSFFGPLHVKYLKSTVQLRFWPLNSFKWFDEPDLNFCKNRVQYSS